MKPEQLAYLDGAEPTPENPNNPLPEVTAAPDLGGTIADAGLLARQARAIVNSRGLWMDEEHQRQEALQELCNLAGVPFPASRWGFGPAALRLCDPHWWQKQLYKRDRRDWEAQQIAAGMVRKGAMLYCTDAAVMQWKHRRTRNAEMLQQVFAFNDDAFIADLATIAAGSISNPEVRRAELFTRLRGLEEYATAAGHVSMFATITCPSRMHPSSRKYDGTTPRQAQNYLTDTWARIRSKLAREGFEYYGLRVAEPHHDGCPHWHVLIFCRWADSRDIRQTITSYAREADAGELRSGQAKRARCYIKHLNPAYGSAVGYISKYIAKNIDGKTSGGQSVGAVDDQGHDCGDAISSAERVTAWASLWGIRQFQQFGGQRVGPWRELRRIHWQITGNAVLEAARKAADSGQWAEYMRAAEQTEIGIWRECRALELLRQGDEKGAKNALSKWKEPVFKVKGITGPGVEIQTRRDDWHVMTEAALHDAIHDAIFDPGESFAFWCALARNLELAKPARAFLGFLSGFARSAKAGA